MKIGSVPLTPIWREGLLGVELASLLRSGVFRDPPPAPRSLPVLLVPGFLTGDAQLGTLAAWLRRCGHRTHTSGIRLNVDCSAAAMQRVEQRLEAWVEQEGEPAVVIGQSRGGLFARVLAVRRPDLVGAVVTLGSPHLNPFAVHPIVWLQGAAIAGLGALGVPGFATHRCRNGGCCKQFAQDLAAPVPKGVRFVSIYSRRDGIVDWPVCLDPHAAQVEVRSTHCGMAVNAAVYEQLDSELHAPRPQTRLRRASRPRAAAA
ncbi:MAG TPA: alpha/beta hydrolase-fold protein [Solirubrobacterales bacterium]|nr:alpha/beta hydrolase-fold protein [Solirubrobacterales bacterium]